MLKSHVHIKMFKAGLCHIRIWLVENLWRVSFHMAHSIDMFPVK